MLWTISAVLMLLWLIGVFAGAGDLIHLLLAASIILFVSKLQTGRRTI